MMNNQNIKSLSEERSAVTVVVENVALFEGMVCTYADNVSVRSHLNWDLKSTRREELLCNMTL
jgi:hypothetical protein